MYWKADVKSPRSLLSSRLNSPSSLSLSSSQSISYERNIQRPISKITTERKKKINFVP